MVEHRNLISHVLFALLLLAPTIRSSNGDRKDYIVYMGKLSVGQEGFVSNHHADMISKVVDESFASSALIRSYNRSFNGFVARLTETEADELAAFEEVVSVFLDTMLELQTTSSWNFLGLNASSPRDIPSESNMTIGVIDSGIWPESESFTDEGFRPPPKNWKGACKGGANFSCNNKLIGARFYSPMSSARDEEGHGTHTASTAAGNPVVNANFYGLARGEARGGVPSARIAAYRSCLPRVGCLSSNILAAFDDAIADGVDIITVSIGTDGPEPFIYDPVAIGSFHAMEKGILTTQSAGNSGREWKIISSTAPWLFSIAASSLDRKFIDKIVLGSGIILTGISVNSFEPSSGYLPLVLAKDVGNTSRGCLMSQQKQCYESCLDHTKATGKIVLCDYGDVEIAALETHRVGAAGAIFTDRETDVADVYPFQAMVVNVTVERVLKHYVLRTKNPMVKLLKSETITDPDAPLVASFSSSGPNTFLTDIMKPDVTAPGIDILAAFSPNTPPSIYGDDPRRVPYNVLSGTSMSCPHVAAAAAYVKSFHPDWSPSAIKSAIMTTARRITQNGIDEFSYGSGEVDPVKALTPGLVYEIPKEDYAEVLCSLGVKVSLITESNTTCEKGSQTLNPKDLNYPAVVAAIPGSFQAFTVKASRTVRNVGLPNSTYMAMQSVHPKLDIFVTPRTLRFESIGEEKSFTVYISGTNVEPREVLSSSLVWSDGIHAVRSPIVVYGP